MAQEATPFSGNKVLTYLAAALLVLETVAGIVYLCTKDSSEIEFHTEMKADLHKK
jgi:hypothetical protein